MAENDSGPLTKIEVLTADYHLEGTVATKGRRFSTWLNLEEASTFDIGGAALKSLAEAQTPEVRLGETLINRAAIVAVIPQDEPSGPATGQEEHKPLEYVDKEQHQFVMSAPPFALKGYLHVARGADLSRALISFPGSFIPVTQTRIIYTPRPELAWEGDVVLVNGDKVQLLWPAGGQQEGPAGERSAPSQSQVF
jgi:hypothetical protein